MRPHPVAELFPEMRDGEFDELVADIREYGLRNPIVVTEGMILDGRNRWRACQQLGIKPTMIEWDRQGSPEAFVVSENLHRRHLTESQRAMVASRLANRLLGSNQHGGSEPVPILGSDTQKAMAAAKLANHPSGVNKIHGMVSQVQAAALFQISDRTIRDAKTIQDRAIPDVVTKVEDGTIPIAVALDIAAQPEAKQKEIVQTIEGSGDKGRAVRKHVPNSRKASPPMRKNKAGVMLPVKTAVSDKEEQRKERMRFQAALWSQLKTGIDNLCGLPRPEDVAVEVESLMRRYPIADKVNRAAMWLRSFKEIINGK